MLNRRISPYLTLRGGYSFNIEQDNGIYANPALGIIIRLSDKLAIHAGADWEGHNLSWDWPGPGLNLGLSF